jgi:hypothetical protein
MPFTPYYRRPGEGRDPVTGPIRLDPGLRRDDGSVDISGRSDDQSNHATMPTAPRGDDYSFSLNKTLVK